MNRHGLLARLAVLLIGLLAIGSLGGFVLWATGSLAAVLSLAITVLVVAVVVRVGRSRGGQSSTPYW